jgi:hypothetical protein
MTRLGCAFDALPFTGQPGQPRVTMVWMDVYDDEVLFTTETRLIVRISVDRISGFAPGFKPWV